MMKRMTPLHDTTQRGETSVVATRFGAWRWPGLRALPSISIGQGLIEQGLIEQGLIEQGLIEQGRN